MEQKIEYNIDRFLDQIASGLYQFGIMIGIVLVLSGVILLWKRNKNKKQNLYGIICICFGVIAMISSFIQGDF